VLGLRRVGEAGIGRATGNGQRAAGSGEEPRGGQALPVRQEERGGAPRRGRFAVEQMSTYHPLDGRGTVVLRSGDPLVTLPDAPVTSAQVAAWCAGLGAVERLTLRLRTPLRLVIDGKLVGRLTFDALMRRVFRRVTDLGRAFGAEPAAPARFDALLAQAARVAVVDDRTRWLDLESRSARQGRRLPIGGLVGAITFAGDLTPFLPWLTWAALVGAGRTSPRATA